VIWILEYDYSHISKQEVNLLSNVQVDIMGINGVVSYDRIVFNNEIIPFCRIHWNDNISWTGHFIVDIL